MAAPKPKKADVVAVAKELYDLIKPIKNVDGKEVEDLPPVEKGTVADNFNWVKKASGLLEKGDVISQETADFFVVQGIEHAATIRVEKVTPKSKTPVKDKKTKVKDKKVTTEKKKEAKYTRLQSFLDALTVTADKPKTLEEIAELMIKSHQLKNPQLQKTPKLASAVWAARDYIEPLVFFEVVKMEDMKYRLIRK